MSNCRPGQASICVLDIETKLKVDVLRYSYYRCQVTPETQLMCSFFPYLSSFYEISESPNITSQMFLKDFINFPFQTLEPISILSRCFTFFVMGCWFGPATFLNVLRRTSQVYVWVRIAEWMGSRWRLQHVQRHQVMRTSKTTSMHSQVRGSVEGRNRLPCAVMIECPCCQSS